MRNMHSNAWLLERPVYFSKPKFSIVLLFPALVSLTTGTPGTSASPGSAARQTQTPTSLPFLGGQRTLSEDTSTEPGRTDL